MTGAGRRLGRIIALDLAAQRLARRRALSRVRGRGCRPRRGDRTEWRKAAAFAADLDRLDALPEIDRGLRHGARRAELPHQQRRALRARHACHARRRDMAGASRCQSRAPVFLTQAFAESPARRRGRKRHQYPRPESVAPRPRLFLLHHRQGGAVVRHANDGAGARAEDQGQRHRARSRAQARGAKPERVRAGVRRDPAAKGRERRATSRAPSGSCSKRPRSPARSSRSTAASIWP